ncbi:MAG: TIGR03087 family PEP-CTERM/XrtA system glycosyltransferase [Desulfobacterales bacterium]
MKILYISHRIPYPPNKGDKVRSFNEIKYFSCFHEIDLAALVDNPTDFRYESDLKKYCRNVMLAPLNPLQGKVRGLFRLFQGQPLSAGYFYSKFLQKKIDLLLSQNDYDAIVCFSSPMAEYLCASKFHSKLFSEKKQPKLIMDFCDLDSDKWRQYAGNSAFPLNLIYRMECRLLLEYEKKINRTFDRSIFISQQEADLFYHLYPRACKISVIPNGVDHQYFSPRGSSLPIAEKKGPALLFTGAMDYYANVDGVCRFCTDIFPIIKAKHADAQFYIVGSKPDPRVRELEKIRDVHVTGFVEDIRPYYEMADVSVIPLRIARGVQNKVLEAMSMGKAVVATSTSVKGIAADHEGNLRVADTAEAFARSVFLFLENEKLRRQAGSNLRSFVKKHYDWESNMKYLEELLFI